MMKKNLICLMAAVAAMASCQKQVSQNIENTPQDKIVFTAGGALEASVGTKGVDALTTLSSFNVLCVTGTLGSNETSVFNASFSGSTQYEGGQFWPLSDAGYKFYASNASLTSNATGATISATNDTDVICALNSKPTFKSSNKLVFEHIFARIGTCNISAPEGYSIKTLSVKITPKVSGTYNLLTGSGKTDGTGWTGTADGTDTKIASHKENDTVDDLYVVPGSYTLSVDYTLEQGAYRESFQKTADVALKAGAINNISATLPVGNASGLVFTVEITPWGNNDITANVL